MLSTIMSNHTTAKPFNLRVAYGAQDGLVDCQDRATMRIIFELSQFCCCVKNLMSQYYCDSVISPSKMIYATLFQLAWFVGCQQNLKAYYISQAPNLKASLEDLFRHLACFISTHLSSRQSHFSQRLCNHQSSQNQTVCYRSAFAATLFDLFTIALDLQCTSECLSPF